MAIIPVPAKFSFTDIPRFGLQRAGNTLRSRYTAASQRIVYPFAIWQLQGKLVDYDGHEAAKIRSFLIQLEGKKNTFRLPVPGYTKPTSGYAGPNPIAGVTASRATSMSYTGASAFVPLLNEGDYFTIGDELKMCTSSISSNGAGSGTISFQPAMRKAILSATIIIQNPTVLMHAEDDDVATWGLNAPYFHKVNFTAVEAIDI